jgi:hypothetical protein
MTVRIANGYLLTPAPWLRAREPVASEPIRAEVIVSPLCAPLAPQTRALAASCANVHEAVPLPPAQAATGSSSEAARAAQAYAAASEPLRAWAVGSHLRVQA